MDIISRVKWKPGDPEFTAHLSFWQAKSLGALDGADHGQGAPWETICEEIKGPLELLVQVKDLGEETSPVEVGFEVITPPYSTNEY